MDSRTHYEILGVSPQSSTEHIKTAYRNAILKHHPDKAGAGNALSFIDVQKAFETLSDGGRRKEYDQLIAVEDAKQNVQIDDIISMDAMELQVIDSKEYFTHCCRCGGTFAMALEDFENCISPLLLPCTTCSLYIKVIDVTK